MFAALTMVRILNGSRRGDEIEKGFAGPSVNGKTCFQLLPTLEVLNAQRLRRRRTLPRSGALPSSPKGP